jgi:hypothetical protein
MTVRDYAFIMNVLVRDLERGVLAAVDDNNGDDGGLLMIDFGTPSYELTVNICT